MREVDLTPAAQRALLAHDWPGNVGELVRVGHDAAGRSETLERGEIVRALAEPGTTAARAADTLVMSCATLYRTLHYYGIRRVG